MIPGTRTAIGRVRHEVSFPDTQNRFMSPEYSLFGSMVPTPRPRTKRAQELPLEQLMGERVQNHMIMERFRTRRPGRQIPLATKA